MIRPIDIRLNAAHPDLPLAEAVTYTGAPSTVLIRGVPGNCGRWAITAVFVAATFPDGSTSTRTAVQSANGVWVATLPVTATSGRTAHGLRILADGADENGEAVGGYVLGVADFAVASLGIAPAPEPGETSWQMLYFDAVPGVLRKGDVTKVDGVLKLYNGTAWEPFANVPAPSSDIPAADSGTGSAGTSSAYARGDHVHPTDTSRMAASATGADILSGRSGVPPTETIVEAFSSVGYDLGAIGSALSEHTSDTTIHVTAAEKSTWNGKQNALTAQQLANIAAVSDALAFDATHSYAAGDPVVYNGTLYTFTATHTGAWTGSDVSAVDIIARLAGKLDKSGGMMTPTFASPAIPSGKVVFGTDAAGPYIGIAYGQNVVMLRPSEVVLNDRNVALTAGTGHTGNLAALDANGNPTDAGWTAGDIARYALTTKTIDNGAVTLDDRAINAVAVSSSLASLTVNFPTATSGKVRDFGLRLTVASGITTAPELALPQGVVCENADGEAPEIGADGAATILYFTETASGVFLVKGEVVTAIS